MHSSLSNPVRLNTLPRDDKGLHISTWPAKYCQPNPILRVWYQRGRELVVEVRSGRGGRAELDSRSDRYNARSLGIVQCSGQQPGKEIASVQCDCSDDGRDDHCLVMLFDWGGAGAHRVSDLFARLGLSKLLLHPGGALLQLLQLLGAVMLAALLDGGPARITRSLSHLKNPPPTPCLIHRMAHLLPIFQ